MVKRNLEQAFVLGGIVCLVLATPAFAQQGQVLTELENQVSAAAKGWETTIMDAARSLFWILAGIEVGIAAVWLAIQAASLDSWFAELVRRIMFIGFFAFVLTQGPTLARDVVNSLYQIGAGGGSASPAEVFDAGIRVASQISEQAKFGVFEDNALAIAAVLAMGIVVICFSLVAAIFVAVMVEMYVGLLAGMIMLGLGGSSFTKDFAVRYLVYAFGVGMKLMALVMIAENWLGSAPRTGTSTDGGNGSIYHYIGDRWHLCRGLHHRDVRSQHHPGRRSRFIRHGRHGNHSSRRSDDIICSRHSIACRRCSRRWRCNSPIRAGCGIICGRCHTSRHECWHRIGSKGCRLSRERKGDRFARRLRRFDHGARQRQDRSGSHRA